MSLVKLNAQSPPGYLPRHCQMILSFKETEGACLWVEPNAPSSQGKLGSLSVQQPQVLQGSSLLPALKAHPQMR